MEGKNVETQMLILESLATSVMHVLDKEKHDENLIRFTCIRILKEFYDTDRDKYDTVVKIIQERSKNEQRKRIKEEDTRTKK